MKILEVIHDFLPRHTAGSEVYTYKLSRELTTKGHEVSLFFTEAERGTPQYTLRKGAYDGLAYFEAIVNRSYSGFEETYDNSSMEQLFTEVLEETRPDIIHLQHLINHSMGYIDIARERSIPVVFTLHDYWLTCPLGGQRIRPNLTICHDIDPSLCSRCVSRYSKNSFRLKRLFEKVSGRLRAPSGKASPGGGIAAKSFLKFNGVFDVMAAKKLVSSIKQRQRRILEASRDVDLFIAPSHFLKDRLVEFGIPAEKILYSDYGFDTAVFSGKKKKTGRGKKLRFGYTGSLVPHKGVHVLVEAFRGIDKAKAELKIYGNLTWFPDYVRQLRESAGKSGTRFMGAFDNRDVPEVLSGIDVLVVPSIWFENSPLTIHEAYISGTPVIVSDLGGMAELVEDGVSGFVFETGNAHALREKIEMIINDGSLLARLRKGLPGVKTIKEDADDMERIFKGLIHGKSPAPEAMSRGLRWPSPI
ncbi:MAG: glycosyltransferase family 4 protein [Thermodesulfobacteriota bacterium]